MLDPEIVKRIRKRKDLSSVEIDSLLSHDFVKADRSTNDRLTYWECQKCRLGKYFYMVNQTVGISPPVNSNGYTECATIAMCRAIK